MNPTAPQQTNNIFKNSLADTRLHAPLSHVPSQAKFIMIHSISTPNRLSKFRRFATLAAIGATSLFLTAGSAFAGKNEVNALNAALSPQTIQTATGDQLAAAVVTVINGNALFKPGVVAGEALKGAGSNAPDAGGKIATATLPLPIVAADKIKFAAAAVKTTGTGTGTNVAQVPSFVQLIVDTDADAFAIATKVKAVTSGVGATIGGRALDLTTDAAKLALADAALKNSNLVASAQSISQFVGVTVADSDQFAHDLSVANVKQTLKIAPGVTAADPTNAGVIVTSIVNEPLLVTVLKKAASLAKGVSKVADIEEVVHVGQAIGAKIGSGAVPISQVNAIVKALVQGINAKPFAASGSNRLDNHADEIGEIGAYFVNAISTNSAFTGTSAAAGKKAGKLVVNLLKTIVKTSKSKLAPTLQGLEAPDVSGSVALTIKSLNLNTTMAAAIKAALTNSKTAKKIGGAALAPSIAAAILEVYNAAGDVTKYENGTIPAGAVNDPETDIRNS